MSESTDASARGAAFWICYVVTVLGTGVGVIYSIVAVVVGGLEDANALYAAARSVALAVLALVSPLFRWDDALLAIAVALTIVHGIDTYVGAVQGDVRTIVPAALCILTIVSATFLARSDRVRGRA